MMNNLTKINRLYLESNEIYHNIAKKFSLSDSCFWILYCLRMVDKRYTQADLVRELSLSKQTINSAIKSLEEKELITYEIKVNHKNKYLILTDKGYEFCFSTIDKVFEIETRILERMGDEDIKEYIRIFDKYNELLKEELHEN